MYQDWIKENKLQATYNKTFGLVNVFLEHVELNFFN